MLQGRDQDRKLRINLLYTAMGGLGGVEKDLRWFKSNLKLQTAYVSSLGHLQTPGEVHIPSLMRRIRISRLKCCSLTSDSEKMILVVISALLPYVGTSNGLRWSQPPTDRDHIKTHKSHDIGAHFGHKICQTYWGLRRFKKVLVVILGSSL